MKTFIPFLGNKSAIKTDQDCGEARVFQYVAAQLSITIPVDIHWMLFI